MIFSEYAVRHGIDNMPSQHVIRNLEALCRNILDPLQEIVNRPLVVTSGYRSEKVNTGIRGSARSQHMQGEAADIVVWSLTVNELFNIVSNSDLPYDQLIDEFSKWIHISYSKRHRRQRLFARRMPWGVAYIPAK